jgi:hypothetical protein
MIKNKMSLNTEIQIPSSDSDIYSGNEKIKFNNRHPIYKTLLKLEFEDAIREYMKIRNQN